MAAFNTDGSTDDTGDTPPDASGDAADEGSDVSEMPTTPTVCTAANQGRCECPQLDGFIDGVVTYTWWDVTFRWLD